AAVLDPRIGRVVAEGTVASYRLIVDQPVHRNVSEIVIPGVLRRYDTADLLKAVSPRRVDIVSPLDAEGEPVSGPDFEKAFGSGAPYLGRAQGEPLPVD